MRLSLFGSGRRRRSRRSKSPPRHSMWDVAMLRLRRAELLQLRAEELVDEAKRAAKRLDQARLDEIEVEMDDVLAQLREIHRESLEADVQRYGE